jgi:hypothetical protein
MEDSAPSSGIALQRTVVLAHIRALGEPVVVRLDVTGGQGDRAGGLSIGRTRSPTQIEVRHRAAIPRSHACADAFWRATVGPTVREIAESPRGS